jgi:hypothetical protein
VLLAIRNGRLQLLVGLVVELLFLGQIGSKVFQFTVLDGLECVRGITGDLDALGLVGIQILECLCILDRLSQRLLVLGLVRYTTGTGDISRALVSLVTLDLVGAVEVLR